MNTHTQVTAHEANSARDNFVPLLPPVDIYENDMGITLTADLPGVSKERLGVKVNGDNLLIEGEVSVPAPQHMELLYAAWSCCARQRAGVQLDRLD